MAFVLLTAMVLLTLVPYLSSSQQLLSPTLIALNKLWTENWPPIPKFLEILKLLALKNISFAILWIFTLGIERISFVSWKTRLVESIH